MKRKLDNTPLHPGKQIKSEIIPSGMSVTKAADLIGIGRPALSNFLNGKASLSPNMAKRIAKAFNCSYEELMEMQANYDVAKTKDKSIPSSTKTYVPPFLKILARDIDAWASNIETRSRLAVFLRVLVNSTGEDIDKIDFPGHDNSQRSGWDGLIETCTGTQWIPKGQSGWEFGTNKSIKPKADRDFDKSVKASPEEERAEITYVFVTPRNWPNKNAWAKSMRDKELWKDVRAYDASDLEQWLEQSLPAQAWFADEIELVSSGVRSLDQCWRDWADVTTPPLSGALFDAAIKETRTTILNRFAKSESGITHIAADSTEEALAFIAQVFDPESAEELASLRDRAIVFDDPGLIPKLAVVMPAFIPVIHTQEVSREFAPYASSMQAIAISPRNAANTEHDVILEPAPYETFSLGLEEMGKSRDEISRLSNESGHSLTVLRRRLAVVPAVKTPKWAESHESACKLIPFFFVGSWNSVNSTDIAALELFNGGQEYIGLETGFQAFVGRNDSPVWSVGNYRGVISKVDLLYAIAPYITAEDLKSYFEIASIVLGEDDPSLDLDEDKQWAAAIYGKNRDFSSAFRKGIAETLVLLAVHGNNLFEKRLGFNTAQEARILVSSILQPLTTRTLESNDNDLPTYAEAAPSTFLSIIERDLDSKNPAVNGLMRPADTGTFGRLHRSGLLWALEGLAWSPETVHRVVLILGRLAEIEINDNWSNKPERSLEAIFRSWMPQTAADHELRVRLLKLLNEKFPDVAWRVYLEQFSAYSRVGHYSHKPRWRTDGFGFGEPFTTWEPIHDFVQVAIDAALSRESYTLQMLSELIERMHVLNEKNRERVWAILRKWSEEDAGEDEKLELREKIRVSLLSRRAKARTQKSDGSTKMAEIAKSVYDALEPENLVKKHAWLFRENWVEESADEIHDLEKVDYEKREERIEQSRKSALIEVISDQGVPGLLELASQGNAAWAIGSLVTRFLLSAEEQQRLVIDALQKKEPGDGEKYRFQNLILGVIHAKEEKQLKELLLALKEQLSDDVILEVLLIVPFGRIAWDFAAQIDLKEQKSYWKKVRPSSLPNSDEEVNDGVRLLLEAKRPFAAFHWIHFHPEKLDSRLLFQLLENISASNVQEYDQHRLERHQVEDAFTALEGSSTFTLEEMAGLEFAYLEILAPAWQDSHRYGLPNLEKFIEQNPDQFVQAVVWAFKRQDEASDPPEFQVEEARVKFLAEKGYHLLDALRRTPGHDKDGNLDEDHLVKWIQTVRDASAKLSRLDLADQKIGQLLSHSKVGEDGLWPCEVVRGAMEDIKSTQMLKGASLGVYNSRGVVQRTGRGGEQEREIAEKYRRWCEALRFSHPFVSSNLLMGLAHSYEEEAKREDISAELERYSN